MQESDVKESWVIAGTLVEPRVSLVMKEKYKRLTLDKRYSIEQMRKAGYTQSAVVSCLGHSGSTISREVRCNLGRRGHRHNHVEEIADQCLFESHKRREPLRFKWQLRVTCERTLVLSKSLD